MIFFGLQCFNIQNIEDLISKLKDVRRRQYIVHAFRDSEKESKLADEAKGAQEELVKARENYTKHNFTLITLLFSLVAFAVSGYFAVDKINQLGQELSSVSTQLAISRQQESIQRTQIAELSATLSASQSINSILTSIVPEALRTQGILRTSDSDKRKHR